MSAESRIDCRDYEADELFTLADVLRHRRKAEAWSNVDELLAQILEHLSLQRIEQYAFAGVDKRKWPEQVRVRRPGDPDPNVKQKPTVKQKIRELMGVS